MTTSEENARVSSTCMATVARNRYSVACQLLGQMVSTRLAAIDAISCGRICEMAY